MRSPVLQKENRETEKFINRPQPTAVHELIARPWMGGVLHPTCSDFTTLQQGAPKGSASSFIGSYRARDVAEVTC